MKRISFSLRTVTRNYNRLAGHVRPLFINAKDDIQAVTSTLMSKPKPIPGLLSAPRITTLFASLFVALSSGSNYVRSDFDPVLKVR